MVWWKVGSIEYAKQDYRVSIPREEVRFGVVCLAAVREGTPTAPNLVRDEYVETFDGPTRSTTRILLDGRALISSSDMSLLLLCLLR